MDNTFSNPQGLTAAANHETFEGGVVFRNDCHSTQSTVNREPETVNFYKKPVLPSPRNAEELLDIYFPDMRSALLETAAALDRIERAENGSGIFSDPRIRNLMAACEILKDGRRNRAEQFLQLFSEPLDKA